MNRIGAPPKRRRRCVIDVEMRGTVSCVAIHAVACATPAAANQAVLQIPTASQWTAQSATPVDPATRRRIPEGCLDAESVWAVRDVPLTRRKFIPVIASL